MAGKLMSGNFASWLYLLFIYLVVPAALWLMACLPMFWWSSIWNGDPSRRLAPGIILLLTLVAAAYETGYKKMYRHNEKRYFFVIFIPPIAASMIGLLYGIFFK